MFYKYILYQYIHDLAHWAHKRKLPETNPTSSAVASPALTSELQNTEYRQCC